MSSRNQGDRIQGTTRITRITKITKITKADTLCPVVAFERNSGWAEKAATSHEITKKPQ
jgi:hypothetical protein